MQFDFYQVPFLGNGLTIGLNAVLHVFISHGFAIGSIAMIALCEYLAYRKSSVEWENFAKEYLKFSIIIITSIGAVTGVGIWFMTSAMAPRAIGSLLRIFFWPWFVEWIVFTAELIVILIYYFSWDKWTGNRKIKHIRLGFAYVLFGFASAFLISGILGFMLTSGDWPQKDNFWSAFFNATYLPQALLRICTSLALGAVLASAFTVLTKRDPVFRKEALRMFGKIFLVLLPLVSLLAWWYFAMVPARFKTFSLYSTSTSLFSQIPELFWIVNAAGLLILIFYGLVLFRESAFAAKILAIPIIVICAGFVSEYERTREFIRGPYLIPGYMYTSQILLKERPLLNQEGMLKNAYWFNALIKKPTIKNQGAYLFGQNCASCHSIGGINNIVTRTKNLSEDGIYVVLGHTHEMIPFMPPFSGTEEERKILARFLFQLCRGEIQMNDSSRFLVLEGPKTSE